MEKAPKLSVVVTSRNDNHGGDLLRRMQIFVDTWFAQCEKFQFNSELIVVEWNPPAERGPLKDALRWPQSEYCRTRVITVPAEIHSELANSGPLPMFQMIAKNVGIRRARASAVLATNIDLIFSDELMEELSALEFRSGNSYRVDRWDVPGELTGDARSIIESCGRTVIRVAARNGILVPGAPKKSLEILRKPVRALVRWGRRGLTFLGEGRGVSELLGRVRRHGYDLEAVEHPVHTNACGDFTLLTASDWEALRGYPEFPIFSLHLDSLLLYQAYFMGIEERMLQGKLFHMEHGGGWTPEAERSGSLYRRLADRKIPWFSNEHLRAWWRQMRELGGPVYCNDERWGYAGKIFPEQQF